MPIFSVKETRVNQINTNKFIGREREIAAFKKYMASGWPEFFAVYGRRRVGKTFLIRKALGKHFHFEVSGSFKKPKSKQLENFSNALAKCSKTPPQKFRSWTEAFFALEQHIDSINRHRKRIVLFIDELPWMDTPKSGFVRALDYSGTIMLRHTRRSCSLSAGVPQPPMDYPATCTVPILTIPLH